MLNNIKVRISLLLILFMAIGGVVVQILVQRLQEEVVSSYEEQSKREQVDLFNDLIRTQKESIVAYVKPWLVEENLEPLFSEDEDDGVDREAWEDGVFTLGNQLAVAFGVMAVNTYNVDQELIYQYDTGYVSNTPALDLEAEKKLVEESYNSEANVFSITYADGDLPVLTVVLPSTDPDLEISHFHAFSLHLTPVLGLFKKATSYDSNFSIGQQSLDSGKFNYQVTSPNLYSKEGDSDQYLQRTLFLGLPLFEKAAKLQIFVKVTELNQALSIAKQRVEYALLFLSSLLAILLITVIYLLLRPLNKMTRVASAVKEGKFDRRVGYSSKTEIGTLSKTMDVMLDNIEATTSSLRKKTNDVSVMLENLDQGVMTVIQGGLIHEEYSKKLEEIVNKVEISGQKFMEIVFPGKSISADNYSKVDSALEVSIGGDEINYELNEDNLVRKYELDIGTEDKKHIEVDWIPILVEGTDEIEKILVSIRDVTELTKVRQQSAEKEEEIRLIYQMLSIPAKSYHTFMDHSKELVAETEEFLEKVTQGTAEEVDYERALRDLHTIKGNSRLLEFSKLVEIVHHAETAVLAAREDNVWDPAFEQMKLINNELQIMHDVFQNKLAKSHFFDLDKHGSSQELTLSEVLEDVLKSLPSMAKELGKELPEVVVDHPKFKLPRLWSNVLHDAFTHVISNAIDHGIENVKRREELGKPPAGKVEVSVHRKGDVVTIKVKDDGRGLDLAMLKAKAAEKIGKETSTYQDSDVAEMIFLSGFSTKDEISKISGRGVGMGALRSFIVEHGGKVWVELESGFSSCRPFTIIMEFPYHYDGKKKKKVA